MTGGNAQPVPGITVRLLTQPYGDRPQPTWDQAEVLDRSRVGTRYHRFTLGAPTIARTARAGQFVMVTVGNGKGGHLTLPRPMAIHRRHPADGSIEIVFAVVGVGTAALARTATGEALTVVGPLGNGFPQIDDQGAMGSLLLLGRGIGVCGVMTAAEDAAQAGMPTVAVFSARDRQNVIGMDDAADLGIEATAVDDLTGSSHPDAVRTLLTGRFAAAPPGAVLVCGSRRLVALAARLGQSWSTPVSMSVEAHMACGLGYCHGCALVPGPTSGDYADDQREGPLACLDGPVFRLVHGAA